MYKDKAANKIGRNESTFKEHKNTGALPRSGIGTASKPKASLKKEVRSESQTKNKTSGSSKLTIETRKTGMQKLSENKKSGAISKTQGKSAKSSRQVSNSISKKISTSNQITSSGRSQSTGKERKASAKHSTKKERRTKTGNKPLFAVVRCAPFGQSDESIAPLPADTFAACQAAFMHSLETQSAVDESLYLPLQDLCPHARIPTTDDWKPEDVKVRYVQPEQPHYAMAETFSTIPSGSTEDWMSSSQQATPQPNRAFLSSSVTAGNDVEFVDGSTSSGYDHICSSSRNLLCRNRKRRNGPKRGSDSSISDLSDATPVPSSLLRPGAWRNKYTDESGHDEPDF